ncbi:MAG: hypothetical protein WBA28_03185 [Microbacteriaceae bacterium]
MAKPSEHPRARIVNDAVEAYFSLFPDISRAAHSVGYEPDEFVVLLINQLFGVSGGRFELERAGSNRNHGEPYTAVHTLTIYRMLVKGNTLGEIAASLGRSVLGVGWKALTLPTVHKLLQERDYFSNFLSYYDFETWIESMQSYKRSARYAFCLPTLQDLLAKLNQQMRSLARFTVQEAQASADEVLEPLVFRLDKEADLLNRLIHDEPIGDIAIWLKIFNSPLGPRMMPVILRGEQALLNIFRVLGLGKSIFAPLSALPVGHPREQIVDATESDEVWFDIHAKHFVPAESMAEQNGQYIRNIRGLVGAGPDSLVQDAQRHILLQAFRGGKFYDPELNERLLEGMKLIESILDVTIPVSIAIGGDEKTARELLSVDLSENAKSEARISFERKEEYEIKSGRLFSEFCAEYGLDHESEDWTKAQNDEFAKRSRSLTWEYRDVLPHLKNFPPEKPEGYEDEE